jgi:hypothetical protein
MKLERERDIPAFKGKTWRERMVLRSQAKERDHFIIWIQCLSGVLAVPILALSHWIVSEYAPHTSLLLFFGIYMIIAYPLFTLFYGFFITPRIRRALDSDAKPSA